MSREKGFSLIELLIVVAIILIIAAIAIPNLLRARMSANDSGAAETIRTLNTAELTYNTSYPSSGFAQALSALGPNGQNCSQSTNISSSSACLVDQLVACAATNGPCPKSGYNFYLTGTAPASGQPASDYTASAGPIGWYTSGTWNWCSAPDSVVRRQGVPQGATASIPGAVVTSTCYGYTPAQ